MAVSVNSFLNLESTLASRLFNAWRRETNKTLRKIVEQTSSGNFTKAHEIADDLDISKVVDRNENFIELIGVQAALFGASRLRPVKQTSIARGEKPEQVELATQLLGRILKENGEESIRRTAHQLIDKQEADQQEASIQVQKTNTAGFVRTFTSSVNKEGKSFIDIGSSLHTSRLSSWGFLTEAEVVGADTYQISEQLDSRTCPVCRTMHGKTFTVAPAKAKVESHLSIQDPDALKAVATWPKQDKGSIRRMQGMSESELQNAGMDTPPYHPRCRGILVHTGSVKQIARPVDTRIDDAALTPSGVPEDVPFIDAEDWAKRFADPNVTAEAIIDSLSDIQKARVAEINKLLSEGIKTIDEFTDATGAWLPERQALHEQWLMEFFDKEEWWLKVPAAGEKPTLIALGGRGGSGKSFFTNSGLIDKGRFVVIDADEFKKLMKGVGYDGWNASLFHDESSYLMSQALKIAKDRGLNVVLDGTMAGLDSMVERIATFASTHIVEGKYLHAPPHIAAQRAIERSLKPHGRYVPPDVVMGSIANEANFDELIRRGIFGDAWEFWDNSPLKGGTPRLIKVGGT